MNSLLQETVALIEEFRTNPSEAFSKANAKKGLPSGHYPVVRRAEEVDLQIGLLSSDIINAADNLMFRLDAVNKGFVTQLTEKTIASGGTEHLFRPIRRCGLYVPRGLPSTAFTYLSAAHAAGVRGIVVYVAQNDDGRLDPAVCYVARRYGAQIWGGPARYGFPALAFGVPNESAESCDLVCGPCGNKLNALKQLSCMFAGRACDMGSGASELAVLADGTADWDQILRDALSQLEHGPDSTVHLVIVGQKSEQEFALSAAGAIAKNEPRIKIRSVSTLEGGVALLNTLAPETVELWLERENQAVGGLHAAGVVYQRQSSSLGDYAAIGRGCGDPTGGMARAQSGVSPLAFLRLMPVVSSIPPQPELLEAAILLSHYEKLPRHERAVRGGGS